MPNNEEKMFVLKMLEEGKITSEEAARLLEALDANEKKDEAEMKGNYTNRNQEPQGSSPNASQSGAYQGQGFQAHGYQAYGNNSSQGANGYGSARQDNNEQRDHQYYQAQFKDELKKVKETAKKFKQEFNNNYSKDFDKMVDEFSAKGEKLVNNLAKSSYGIMEKVNDFLSSYVDTNSFNIFGSYNTLEKTFEAFANEGTNLEVEGVNGQVVVKKHLDDKVLIKARVRCASSNIDELLKFDASPEKISLKVNKITNMSAAYEIFVPALLFDNIKIETTNGKIYMEDTLSRILECRTRNGKVELMGVNSGKIEAATRNSHIACSYITGDDINIDTNNASIDVKHIKIRRFKASTTNARIMLENVQAAENVPVQEILLKTSNAGIKVYMNDMETRGYYLRAKTSNGGVNLLVPDLIYKNPGTRINGQTEVEAMTTNVDGYTRKVDLKAETTNGYIEIVK